MWVLATVREIHNKFYMLDWYRMRHPGGNTNRARGQDPAKLIVDCSELIPHPLPVQISQFSAYVFSS